MNQVKLAETEQNFRTAHKFKNLDAALDAARGQFPTDVIVAISGDMNQPSVFAHDAATIRTLAELREFGKHPDDTVAIWLRGDQSSQQQAA